MTDSCYIISIKRCFGGVMLAELLLNWYDLHQRRFVFRGPKDPYLVWVSEIMLQQTRTETVEDYYIRFTKRFPDIRSLAAADEGDVLKAWEGLGYYSRARNMQKCARVICDKYGGIFPDDYEKVRALPGIGPYTTASVLSIAFDRPYPAMDGNLTRVLSRVYGVRECVDTPAVAEQLRRIGEREMPARRCGDFNQALMDIGATICLPGTPDCEACPLQEICDACKKGDAPALPVKKEAKPPVPVSVSVLIIKQGGRVLMQQREQTLLKGLWTYLLFENKDRDQILSELKRAGIECVFLREMGKAVHVFTHRIWNMTIFECEMRPELNVPAGYLAVTKNEMEKLPMPVAMKAARKLCMDEVFVR
ncbi:MAG: A/G-specific adenine glycosylase [Clostridiales bacterium]|nr:A/G-specific adenine glycosylase [Clostridiales bacterium]